ncbi:MAG: PH domain-containing protein [bacterium]|nr:PH domain-containing protein [bacterium]
MPPLENNEQILYTARKHWFILAGESVVLVVLAIIPSIFLFAPYLIPRELLQVISETVHLQGNFFLIVLFLWSLLLIILWIIFTLLWTDYYLDVWFVTNFRIIAIEQIGLFNRKISTFRLDMIQDATVKVPGVLSTLIGFGTVEVSTASNGSFRMKGVANPNTLKEKIMEEHHRIQGEKQEVSIKSPVDEHTERF